MKSKKQIEERLEMWKTILDNMIQEGDNEENLFKVRIRIFEYCWILD
ncbi:MAG TPA: hypothetical protein VL854_05780 [Nitrososphaeraceae archaeon]|jgi:hypothetical protein|nr:hypothetical protein [Nitrososphaeraceae archaeon]